MNKVLRPRISKLGVNRINSSHFLNTWRDSCPSKSKKQNHFLTLALYSLALGASMVLTIKSLMSPAASLR